VQRATSLLAARRRRDEDDDYDFDFKKRRSVTRGCSDQREGRCLRVLRSLLATRTVRTTTLSLVSFSVGFVGDRS